MRTVKALSIILVLLMAGWLLLSRATGIAASPQPPPPTEPVSTKAIRFPENWPITAGDDPLALVGPLDYPPDPTADIPWSGGTSGAADIQAAFNNARNTENGQLGTSVPSLTMPSQAEWDTKSDGEKALWLINREREDRGLHPLHGLETNVTSVAQYYAQYLVDNNAFSHTADGRTPWERLHDNAAIGACHDYLAVAENLAAFWTSGTSIPLPVERSVYRWMYEDSGSSWGHRHAILWYPYDDNSGPTGKEGFLGIGRAGSSSYDPYGYGLNYGEAVVMNVFDPCATWTYEPDPLTEKTYLPCILRNYGHITTPKPGYWEGGAVGFTVTSDSTQVDDFRARFYLPDCGTLTITRTAPVDIIAGSFSFSGSYYASGSFNSATSASGVVGLDNFYVPGCGYYTGEGEWTATWQRAQALSLLGETTEGTGTVVYEVAPPEWGENEVNALPSERGTNASYH